ncbi:glycoside hydrolase family 13 protein [Nocardioides sp. KIGAM211]|uniref:Glycoside hydrolase family 13 protein n=1 Tax=Nocardioides luti TaxID=2761101 RepID=A0A7X0RH32_9ACTN|nr:alpha-amylase family glycosyl hydrolase [Nocardioides luti]MBB6627215.1 glycoside hydrolase family 13 protein [Nocardioides luti]
MTYDVDPLAPHHDGSPAYVGASAPALGERVELRVRVPHRPDGTPGARAVVLRAVRDGEPAITPAEQAAGDDAGAWWSVTLALVNPVTSYRFLVSNGPADYRWLTATGVHARDVTDAGDFLISTEHRVPCWVADQVAYQVFPDRFERTETGAPVPEWARPVAWDDAVVHRGPEVPFQWYGGTLDGVAARIDHLERLGATLLYLTPVFEAGSTHRYDAVSFERVDPLLGGDAALERLADTLHERGLRLVGDLTTNHTGDRHDWFRTAAADPASVERAFYRFEPDGSYASWLGIASLPKLDHASAELARRLYDGPDSVVARWLRRGLDGWRVDVANMTGRLGAEDRAHAVAATTRRTMAAESPDAWLLAEHGHDATGDLRGAGWHGTMDYAGFTRPLWCWLNGGSPDGPGLPHGLDYLGLPVDIPVLPAERAVATMREVHGAIPFTVWQSGTNHLDSHDTPRFRTVTGGGTSGGTDLVGAGRPGHLVGLALQMTMPGVPVVFMGDEIGLTAVDGEHARTPYPWHDEQSWDAPTLAAYREWIELRHRHVALRRGGLRWLHAHGDAMTFLREHPDQTLLVHATRAAGPEVRLPLAALGPDPVVTTLVGPPARVVADELVLPGEGPAASVHLVSSGGPGS